MIKLSEPKTPCAISLFPNFPSKSATIFVPSLSFKIISFFLTNLLTIFNDFDINATWAIVAGMLDKNNPMIKNYDSKVWYNPKIIEKIQKSKKYQEIASHSYAHPNFLNYSENEIE